MEEALDRLEDSEVDFILMDVGLPGISGVGVARRLKDGSKFNNPIIAITAYASKDERENCKNIFDDYISKPIDEDDLEEVIRIWAQK